ncbi:TonB-dependent receptor [Pseudohongiella sp. O18]|uniref:TonB-dependent receptor n=1 Tax=Pseudohongiella sp. O18 TaxID=2904248 RepID=UPI001F1B9981|nr:TonB-dependent receptor [Pseudohongiella sp. O18]
MSTANRKFQKTLLAAACAAASAAVIPSAFAQSGTPAIEEIQVISTSRRPESLSDVNASIAVLSEEELRLISHTHIQEAANRLPGVNINRNNGQESLTAIRSPVLSGGGACGAFLLAEQGIPLRAAGFCNVNELFDSHSENAERIEVIRGPGTAFYGSNAVHGMINVVLPRAGTGNDLTVEYGPRGTLRGNARIGFGEDGGVRQTVLLNGISEEGFRPESGYDQQKGSWLYETTLDNGMTLDGGITLTNLNQETAGYVVGAEAYKDDDLRRTNPNPEAYRNNRSMRAWTRISYELDGDWDVVLTPYYRDADLDFIQHFLPGTPTETNQHSSVGMQFASYKQIDEQRQLAAGVDVEFTSGSLVQRQDQPTQGSAFLQATIPQGRHYDYDVDATQMAPFVQYQQYWDSGFDVTLGLRFERIGYDYTNNMISGRTREDGTPCGFGGCRYNRPSDRQDTFGNWAPKFALRYALNDSHDVQFRVTRGYRAPQATELYRLQNDQNVADLDAVKIDSVELGFEGSVDRLQYEAVAYYMDKDNEIITDSNRINLNNMHTRHRGIELSGAYEISDAWRLSAAYNHARHTYENDEISNGVNLNGKDVATAPRNFGSVQLQWRPSTSLMTELQWVAQGEYYTSPDNLNSYEGHDVLNLRTRWDATEDLTLSVNILNLTDRKYAERADWSSFGGDRYFPGEPLRAFVALNWRFN